MAERPSGYERDPLDWYVESPWCVDLLLDRVMDDLGEGLHDPCAGLGTIPRRALERGVPATMADIVCRPGIGLQYPECDFFHDLTRRPSIVTNPPYGIAVRIIEHALEWVAHRGIVAALVQAKFLFSQGRHPLFERPEMERVIILSRRPSMPPGRVILGELEWQSMVATGHDDGLVERVGRKYAAGAKHVSGGGSMDFLWAIWRSGGRRQVVPIIEWAK